MIDSLKILADVLPSLLKGAFLTVQIASISVLCGVLVGLFVSLGKLSSNKFLRVPARIYVDVIRGTPLFVQILLLYFGFPSLCSDLFGVSMRLSPMLAGVLVCSVNSGAYVAEIFRAGIVSIDKGQWEAAKSLGMPQKMVMRLVVLPQAFKRIVPPLGNEFIILLKDTSLLSVIGVSELTRRGQLYVSVTFEAFTVYIGVALVYLCMTLAISKLVSYLEKRLDND